MASQLDHGDQSSPPSSTILSQAAEQETQETLDESLFHSVSRGDMTECRKLIEKRANVHSKHTEVAPWQCDLENNLATGQENTTPRSSNSWPNGDSSAAD